MCWRTRFRRACTRAACAWWNVVATWGECNQHVSDAAESPVHHCCLCPYCCTHLCFCCTLLLLLLATAAVQPRQQCQPHVSTRGPHASLSVSAAHCCRRALQRIQLEAYSARRLNVLVPPTNVSLQSGVRLTCTSRPETNQAASRALKSCCCWTDNIAQFAMQRLH